MNVRPVEHAPAPGYPDKYDDESRRALATAHPHRWLAAPVAAGLAATVALGLSGCGENYVTMGEVAMTPTEITTGERITTAAGETSGEAIPSKPTAAATAASRATLTLGESRAVDANAAIPLFEFGEGTGTFGCVSIVAPVFLSEEEAFAILSTAFAEAGLTLSPETQTLKRAKLPEPDMNYGNSEKRMGTKRGDLETDGTLAQLPVEFVSTQDVQAWQADTGLRSSVSLYPVKQTAKLLAESNPGLVVFYDPMGSANYEALWSMEQKKGESDEAYYARRDAMSAKLAQEARAQSEAQLREQAAAFLRWLSKS